MIMIMIIIIMIMIIIIIYYIYIIYIYIHNIQYTYLRKLTVLRLDIDCVSQIPVAQALRIYAAWSQGWLRR